MVINDARRVIINNAWGYVKSAINAENIIHINIIEPKLITLIRVTFADL